MAVAVDAICACYTRRGGAAPESDQVDRHAKVAPPYVFPQPLSPSSTIGAIMKQAIALLLLAFASSSAFAAGRSCEELKAELTAKLDAHGVKDYTLEIVDNADIKADRKVIGSCAAGSKKIVYSKNKPST